MSAMSPEFEAAQRDLRELAKPLLELSIDELTNRPGLGEMNFVPLAPLLRTYVQLVSVIMNSSLSHVSVEKLNALKEQLNRLTSILNDMGRFRINEGNSAQKHQEITGRVKGEYDRFLNAVIPALIFAIQETTNFARWETELQGLERAIKEKFEKADQSTFLLTEKLEQALTSAEETVASIRKASAEAGVAREAVYFSKEAESFLTTQKLWLVGTLAMAALTVAWGVAIVFGLLPAKQTTDLGDIAHYTLGKIIVLSGLYFGLVWCTKNYSASAHNYVVNKHKQNALSTFETFIRAAGADQDIKNAVLLQTTASIFSSPVSGYAGSKDADTDHQSKIIEIVRSVGAKQKGE
jgi:hypothetical protein